MQAVKLMPAAVFDLDGTLSNSDHRLHLVQTKDWHGFHMAGAIDPVIPGVAALCRAANLSMRIIVCTGRNERYRLATMQWLTEQSLFVDDLLMRPDDNFESDAIVKPRMLFDHFGGKDEALRCVSFIVEDRDSMVQAWRELGFECLQGRPGAY